MRKWCTSQSRFRTASADLPKAEDESQRGKNQGCIQLEETEQIEEISEQSHYLTLALTKSCMRFGHKLEKIGTDPKWQKDQ
jgi:hypothetical protein